MGDTQRDRVHWRLPALAVAVLGVLAIVDRIWVLRAFNFRFVDEDQAVLWYVARDLAAGHLREPCFPGQAYGTALESFAAVPLIWGRVPLFEALPLVSAALSLTPFFLWAWLAWREGSPLIAATILASSLLLPNEFGMLTSMPRGFSPGLFTGSLGAILLLSRQRLLMPIGGLLCVAAFSFNESTLLLIVPVLFYVAMDPHRSRQGLIGACLGAAAGFGLHLASRAFYRWNPAYAMHPVPHFALSWKLLRGSLTAPSPFLGPVSPWGAVPALLLCVLMLVVGLAWRRSWWSAGLGLLVPLMVVVSFSVAKVHDGSTNIFFSYARAFLTIPFILAFLLILLGRVWGSPSSMERVAIIVLLLASASTSVWFKAGKMDAEAIMFGAAPGGVEHAEVKTVLEACETYSKVAKETGTSLVAFEADRVAAYGCGAIGYDSLPTLFAPYERRTWRLTEEASTDRDRLLFRSNAAEPCARFARQSIACEIVDKAQHMVLVHHARMPAVSLLREVQSAVRRF